MAGKSTLLRAIGMNALLAQMGSVVCARSFAIPRVEILCAIQVSDSLESGASYFYAEVRRLVSVLNRLKQSSGESAKLFLIDEIFRGTNNRERFLGSWQVISALLNTGAFGVLTTHDLALTRLEQDVEGVRNFHLRETVGGQGQLEFDYLLRSGPCPTTNALIIMQQAGLPVVLDFQPALPQGGLHHV
jgi:DNA mismatch repair ATPase MutS